MTIAKTGAISRNLGAGGQIIANVHAFRATDNHRLLTAHDPEGPENRKIILEAARAADLRIVDYGQPPGPILRTAGPRLAREIENAAGPLHILGLTQNGTPMHPLARGKNRIATTITPKLWTPPSE